MQAASRPVDRETICRTVDCQSSLLRGREITREIDLYELSAIGRRKIRGSISLSLQQALSERVLPLCSAAPVIAQLGAAGVGVVLLPPWCHFNWAVFGGRAAV